MSLQGQRLSQNRKIHLLEPGNQNRSTIYTLCGRKLRRSYALPPENFDFSGECCDQCQEQFNKQNARKAC
jgi:hypothetical protein